jgi:hypothetical protein
MNKDFVRGKNPLDDMGFSGKVKDWFDKNNTASATHHAITNGKIINIEVNGNLVLERFDSEEIIENFQVNIGNVSGTMIIINLLSNQQIYEQIKSFYNRVLDNCLGKSAEEQYDYLFGKDSEVFEAGRVKIVRRLKERTIENSKELIMGFPDVPSDQELLNIINEILSVDGTGKLEYASDAMDDNSVTMNQYANEILRRFNNS